MTAHNSVIADHKRRHSGKGRQTGALRVMGAALAIVVSLILVGCSTDPGPVPAPLTTSAADEVIPIDPDGIGLSLNDGSDVAGIGGTQASDSAESGLNEACAEIVDEMRSIVAGFSDQSSGETIDPSIQQSLQTKLGVRVVQLEGGGCVVAGKAALYSDVEAMQPNAVTVWVLHYLDNLG